jgi:hypothetical protein
MPTDTHPITYAVDYPDRPLNRVSTAFRIFAAIPILIVACTVSGGNSTASFNDNVYVIAFGGGLLFAGPLLMILFREKYPRWWFDWNRELLRFGNRIGAYLALLDDRYPSTDEEQSVHLELPYPDVPAGEINRWMPLVKWFLAIPHYIVLAFLWIGAFFAVIAAWFAILFTGRYPRGLFDYVTGVIRWHNRVAGYALLLVTDAYPPFRLAP